MDVVLWLGIAPSPEKMRQRSGYLASQIVQDFEFEARLGHWFSKPEAVTQRVMDWTEGQPFLTDRLFVLILRSPDNIHRRPKDCNAYLTPPGQWLDEFVRDNCINRCTDDELLRHVRNICRGILEDSRSVQLLRLYQRVLQGQSITQEFSPSLQNRLIQTGLIRECDGRLVLGNRLYAEIFDQQWLRRAFRTVQVRAKVSTQRTVSDLMGNGLPSLAIQELPTSAVPPGAPIAARSQLGHPKRPALTTPDSVPALLAARPNLADAGAGSTLQVIQDATASISGGQEPLALPVRRLSIALLACTLGAVAILAMTYVERWRASLPDTNLSQPTVEGSSVGR